MIRKSMPSGHDPTGGHLFSEKDHAQAKGCRGPCERDPRRRLETLLETENWPMMRTVVVAGALLLGVGAVMAQQEIAVKQDNLMRAQAKSLYTVILKTVKGEIPYDQAAINAAIVQLE